MIFFIAAVPAPLDFLLSLLWKDLHGKRKNYDLQQTNRFGQITTSNILRRAAFFPALRLGFWLVSLLGVLLFFLIIVLKKHQVTNSQ